MKLNKQAVLFFLLLIAITTVVKVICSPRLELSGITCVMAVALFAGLNKFKTKYAFLLPLITLLASNTLLQILYSVNMFPYQGFYNWQLVEYSLVVILTALGLLFRKQQTLGIFVTAVLGPTVFFIVSNYITWYLSWQTLGYTHDTSGLMTCYTAALPFYRNSIISTVVFLPSFIVAYQWIVKGKPSLSLA